MSKMDWFWLALLVLLVSFLDAAFKGMMTVFMFGIIKILAQIRDKEDTHGTK